MSLTPSERALAWVLRLNGVITSLALLAVFMPLDWMAQTHQYLGMGPIPHQPVFEYLARSISFLYFVHGVLCLFLSTDVRRFGPVITCVAALSLGFAATVFWVDEKAAMPRRWTYTEVSAIAFFSGLTLILRLKAGTAGAADRKSG